MRSAVARITLKIIELVRVSMNTCMHTYSNVLCSTLTTSRYHETRMATGNPSQVPISPARLHFSTFYSYLFWCVIKINMSHKNVVTNFYVLSLGSLTRRLSFFDSLRSNGKLNRCCERRARLIWKRKRKQISSSVQGVHIHSAPTIHGRLHIVKQPCRAHDAGKRKIETREKACNFSTITRMNIILQQSQQQQWLSSVRVEFRLFRERQLANQTQKINVEFTHLHPLPHPSLPFTHSLYIFLTVGMHCLLFGEDYHRLGSASGLSAKSKAFQVNEGSHLFSLMHKTVALTVCTLNIIKHTNHLHAFPSFSQCVCVFFFNFAAFIHFEWRRE